MNRKELIKPFMMISKLKNPLVSVDFTKKSALQGFLSVLRSNVSKYVLFELDYTTSRCYP